MARGQGKQRSAQAGVSANYPNVYRAHIVTQGYLRRFASDNKIAVRIGTSSVANIKSTDKAGVRPRAYRRERPHNGTLIDDVEWSLSHIENVAPPVLRSIDELWPLETEDKAILAEFFGYQLVRGPSWLAWQDERALALVDNVGRVLPDRGRELDDLEVQAVSQTQRLGTMLDSGPRVAAIFGCMHWTLIDFSRPVLVTSNEPVVGWPSQEAPRTPQPSPHGLPDSLDFLEFRVPISSARAILMTWLDVPDAQMPRVTGNRQHAANLNAFTIANADREWFHLPGLNPPFAPASRLVPLSTELLPGYSSRVVALSRRRAEVARWLDDVY